MILTPIFVKSFFGKRTVVLVSEGSKNCFSLPKKYADLVKKASGVSKSKKLYVRYKGKDLQIMETLERESGVFLNDSSENSTSNVFEHTNRN